MTNKLNYLYQLKVLLFRGFTGIFLIFIYASACFFPARYVSLMLGLATFVLLVSLTIWGLPPTSKKGRWLRDCFWDAYMIIIVIFLSVIVGTGCIFHSFLGLIRILAAPYLVNQSSIYPIDIIFCITIMIFIFTFNLIYHRIAAEQRGDKFYY